MHTNQTKQDTTYRIKLTVAVYKDKKLVYRNDMLVPMLYQRRSECRAHIRRETQHRLRNSNFFLSPRIDFDLVRYTQQATSNTYLRYRIMEEKNPNYTVNTSGLQEEQAEALTYSSLEANKKGLGAQQQRPPAPNLTPKQSLSIEQLPDSNIEEERLPNSDPKEKEKA